MQRLRYGTSFKNIMRDWVHVDFVILTTPTDIMRTCCTVKLVAWHSGSKLVCDRPSFSFRRST